MSDLLINTWYVADRASSLQEGKPLPARILGNNLVIFQNAQGEVSCLSSVCCHRGAALDTKDLSDGCVQCSYHGWKFDGSGRCAEIPSLADQTKIPARARVDSYPVEIKYGLIWVFLGDLPEDQRPDLPDWFDEFLGKEDTYWFMHYEGDFPGLNWVRALENSADASHLAHVHSIFGGRIGPSMLDNLEVTKTKWGAKTSRLIPNASDDSKAQHMQELLDKDREPLGVELEFSLSGFAIIIRQYLSPDVTQYLMTTKTPVDDDHTITFGVQMRTYLVGEEHDEKIRASLLKALGEDYGAASRIAPLLTPTSRSRELLVASDRFEMEVREQVFAWGARGNAIDVDKVREDSRKSLYVIPSPARYQSSKGWVYESVPLHPASSASVEKAS